MAGPNLPGDINRKEEDKTAIEKEQEQGVDLRRNDDPEPAVMAGLSSDEIGLSARSTGELNDASKIKPSNSQPSSQDLKEEQDAVDHVYAGGMETNAAREQYNDAMSGAGDGRVSGTIFDNIEQQNMKAEEERKKELARAAASYGALDSWDGFFQRYDAVYKDMEVAEKDWERARREVDEAIESMDEDINKLNEQIDHLKPNGEAARLKQERGEELSPTEELQLAQYETAIAARDSLVEEKALMVESLAEIRSDMREKRALLREFRAKEARGEELTEDDVAAMEQLRGEMHGLRNDIKNIQTRAETAQTSYVAVGTMFDQSSQRLKDEGKPEYTQSELLAQQEFIRDMAAARKDGALDEAEIRAMADTMGRTGLAQKDPETFAQFTQGVASQLDQTGLGVRITNEDGTTSTVYGDSAKEELARISEKIKAEYDALKNDADALNDNIAGIETERNELQAARQISLDKVYESSNIVTKALTTGTEEERDNARIAKETVGDNMSILPQVIEDANGNTVFKDYDNDRSYYYMNDNNERVYYEANDPQIDNFENWEDGQLYSSAAKMSVAPQSSPVEGLFSSSSAMSSIAMKPNGEEIVRPRAFGNNMANYGVYLAEYERKSELVNAEQIASQISDLNTQIAELESIKGLGEEKMEEIGDIIAQVESGQIDAAQAQERLEAIKNSPEVLALQNAADKNGDSVQDSSADEWSATESMTLEASDSYLSLSGKIKDQIEGSSINRNTLDEILSGASDVDREQALAYLERQNISIEDPENDMQQPEPTMDATMDANFDAQEPEPSTQAAQNLANNAVQFMVIPGISAPQQSIAAYTPAPDPNGIYASPTAYQSFADTLDAPPDGPTPSYMEPVQNGTKDLTVSPSNQSADAFSGRAPTQPTTSLTPQEEQLRLQQELLEARARELEMARQNELGANSGGGMGSM